LCKKEDAMSEVKVKIPKIITVGELSKRLGVSAASVVSELMKNGVMATINDNIDFETAAIIAEYLGVQVEEEEGTAKQGAPETAVELKTASTDKDAQVRPPVVAIMGHVDHGKTSLLDRVRETNVVVGEAGGITQHIGAYQVKKNDNKITFIDTPGHAAFEEMRAHGAKIVDIVLIIVAADDGIKAQTLEAINHAKKAGNPMIFVINKIDKPGADVNRIYQQMAEVGYVPEEWGGQTTTVKVSAKSGEGIDELLEIILLMAELQDLKANYDSPATGVVIESHMDLGKGAVATILVQNGTLHTGDCIQIGETYGRIRTMDSFQGKRIKEATPGTPVKISGIKDVASPGEPFTFFADEKEAREGCADFKRAKTAKRYSEVKKINLETITSSIAEGGMKELAIVVKADVQGSLDAILQSLGKFVAPEAKVNVVASGVGDVTESDIMMASTASKLIIAFNVGFSSNVGQVAKGEGVKISTYRVIYELLDDIKTALEELLPAKEIEITHGKLEVLAVFSNAKKLTVAGGKVVDGKMEKGQLVKIMRGDEQIATSKIDAVRRGKDEVKECAIGTECGIGLDGNVPVQEKDFIVSYSIEKQKQTLDIRI
jgi:translation initiation factor IF-2